MPDTLHFVAPVGNMICSDVLWHVAPMDHDLDLETPWGRLTWAREAANYKSAVAFAKAVGIHPTTYRAYEAGQNGYAKHAAIFAKKLGVTAEWLLGGGPLPQPQDDTLRPIVLHNPNEETWTTLLAVALDADTDDRVQLEKIRTAADIVQHGLELIEEDQDFVHNQKMLASALKLFAASLNADRRPTPKA